MARRGRAWGNALGGYKRQARDSKGRFGSGKVGSSVKRTRAKASKTTKKYKKKYKNRGTAAQRTLRTASKRKYNKANLNKQLQRNHRKTIAGNYVGLYGGGALGVAIGNASGGPIGGMIGMNVGRTAGMIAAQNHAKSKGYLVTDRDFTRASKDDQAAMARRIKRAQKGHIAIQMAGAARITHSTAKSLNAYDLAAKHIKTRRGQQQAAYSRGIPRVGSTQRYASKGRIRNRNVYNITTMPR